MKSVIFQLVLAAMIFAAGCKDKKTAPPPPPLVKQDKPASATDKPQKGPIINVADTLEQKMTVLYIKDSAATSAGMSAKLSAIYNKKLPDAIKAGKNKSCRATNGMVQNAKTTVLFEAGIPVDKAPAKPAKGILIKKTGGDSALVAHFFGPNTMSQIGYDALNDILKDRHKSKAAPPYEIYVKNPFEIIKPNKKDKPDPYKMETDIVMPYQ